LHFRCHAKLQAQPPLVGFNINSINNREVMSFGQAIASGFSNYAAFSGRASQSEFWFWVLFAMIGAISANIIDGAVFVHHPGISPLNSPFNSIFTLIMLLPSLAAATRRLHDIDQTGWWVLLALTGIGIIVLLYWLSQEGTPGTNRFGTNPLTGRNLEPTQAA
jgi:uncharacterized membrane protein YhaH (DUF805 family)